MSGVERLRVTARPADDAPDPETLADGVLRWLRLANRARRVVWTVALRRLPARRRLRYGMVAGGVVASVWVLTAAYLVLAPVSYRSHITLILPGSGSGGTLNLEKIGQASSSTASPFSATTLSPTESYKRLLSADVTLSAAGRKTGARDGRFPTPKVKLVDQTNLIEIDISGRTAAQAQRNARALRDAFLETLDSLRKDEAVKREAADREHIHALQTKVREAQSRLLDFQARTGLVSIEQFNNRIGVLDSLRDRENQQRTVAAQTDAIAVRLASSLGADPATIRQAFLLKADPVFQAELTRYAALVSQQTEKGATLGDAHLTMEELNAQVSALRAQLAARGGQLTGLSAKVVLQFADLSVSEGRAHLMEGLVNSDSASAGADAALGEVRNQIREQQANSDERVEQAAQLGELTRDLRVAEAVFSSALARLDTNKADPFASYPLVQTFEEPSLPKSKSSPSKMLALAGAGSATVMLGLGFGLLWLRKRIDLKALLSA